MTEEILYEKITDVHYTQRELDEYIERNWNGKTQDRYGSAFINPLAICIESFFINKKMIEEREKLKKGVL